MAERTSYLPGTPSWVDLGTGDTADAAEFYGEVFGWRAELDPRPEAGGYGMFTLRDKLVAGLGPIVAPGAPPSWTVYVSVDDADATTSAAAAAGATVVAEPMDVFDAGRLSALVDPLGSAISLWQPGRHLGAELVNEPGAFTWNELATTDLAAARAFYTSVFGWGVSEQGGDDADIYTVQGNVTCGAHRASSGETPGWSVWFSVEDCDAATATVTGLGGAVLVPPADLDFGRGAVVADRQGAVFGIGAVNDSPD